MILAFCVYAEIVISRAFTIEKTGLIALITVQEKLLSVADAETFGSMKLRIGYVIMIILDINT